MNTHSVRSKVVNVLRRWSEKPDPARYGRAELRLYRAVLKAVAHGHPDARAMAGQALRLSVPNRRWFE